MGRRLGSSILPRREDARQSAPKLSNHAIMLSLSYLLSRPLALTCSLVLSTHVATAASATNEAAGVRWIDVRELNVEGRGWPDTKAFFDRLPAKAEGKVPG